MGPVAHGGHCVARHEGRVVFVRHTLPGERVRVRVTEDRHPGFCRADAIEVLEASPARVERPCPYSGPGRCGGCDWQHVDPAEQRRLKAAVVREQLARLARLPDVEVTVEELPGGPLRWRSRARFAVDRSGAPGLRRHRSHDVVVLDDCPITVEPAAQAVLARRWPGAGAVDVSIDSTGAVTTTRLDRRGHADVEPRRPARRRPARGAGRPGASGGPEDATGRSRAPGSGRSIPRPPTRWSRRWRTSPRCGRGRRCWTSTPASGCSAARSRPRPVLTAGWSAWSPTRRPAPRPTPTSRDLPQAEVWQGEVDDEGLTGLVDELGARPDVVVLDPPRAGAGQAVSRLLAATGARAVIYVACDPAALARDVAAFGTAGYRLAGLRAFDAFPMTAHVECVALLVPA